MPDSFAERTYIVECWTENDAVRGSIHAKRIITVRTFAAIFVRSQFIFVVVTAPGAPSIHRWLDFDIIPPWCVWIFPIYWCQLRQSAFVNWSPGHKSPMGWWHEFCSYIKSWDFCVIRWSVHEEINSFHWMHKVGALLFGIGGQRFWRTREFDWISINVQVHVQELVK